MAAIVCCSLILDGWSCVSFAFTFRLCKDLNWLSNCSDFRCLPSTWSGESIDEEEELKEVCGDCGSLGLVPER